MESNIYSKELLEKAYKKKAKAEKEEAKEEAKKEEKKRMPKPSPLENLKNKEITLHLRNGEVIKGTLLDEWRYEFLIKNEEGEFIILKHAVDYITH